MKIVKPSVELIHSTPNPERTIERMGRICYQSNHHVKGCATCGAMGEHRWRDIEHEMHSSPCAECNGTGTDIESANKFVRMILKRGHESVIEHASAGFMVTTDRGVTHEAVRHRLLSISQESTRFFGSMIAVCGYAKEIIEPPLAFPANRPEWVSAMEDAERHYMNLINGGEKPEIARGVLPNNLKSQIGLSGNFREWRLVMRQRTALAAHPQMREIAEMIRAELLKLSPVCFEDIP